MAIKNSGWDDWFPWQTNSMLVHLLFDAVTKTKTSLIILHQYFPPSSQQWLEFIYSRCLTSIFSCEQTLAQIVLKLHIILIWHVFSGDFNMQCVIDVNELQRHLVVFWAKHIFNFSGPSHSLTLWSTSETESWFLKQTKYCGKLLFFKDVQGHLTAYTDHLKKMNDQWWEKCINHI